MIEVNTKEKDKTGKPRRGKTNSPGPKRRNEETRKKGRAGRRVPKPNQTKPNQIQINEKSDLETGTDRDKESWKGNDGKRKWVSG